MYARMVPKNLGKSFTPSSLRLPNGSSRMNDSLSHMLRHPQTALPTAIWHAILARASKPWGDKASPAPGPLWGIPGHDAEDTHVTLPYGEVIQEVISRYATILGIPTTFRLAANLYSRPVRGDGIHIHAFALPTPAVLFGTWPRVPLVVLPFAHGIPLRDGANRALAPGPQLGRGRLLFDGDGYAVGEVLGTNLYFLFDLLGQEAGWVSVLLRRHLDLGLPHLVPALAGGGHRPAETPAARIHFLREETEALVLGRRLALLQDARGAYVGACQQRVAEEIRFLQTEISFLEDGVEEMARRIAADTRRVKEGRRRLNHLQGWRDLPESGGRELEWLQTLPEVCQARVQDGRISVTTLPILVGHTGRRYRLGSFQLDLHFNGDVRIVNLTDRIGSHDHPHIHLGRPCLGTIREAIAKLLGEFQFVAATEVLIDFLKTVNPADWRLPVFHWPEAECEVERGALAAT